MSSPHSWEGMTPAKWKSMGIRQRLSWMRLAAPNLTVVEAYRVVGEQEEDFRKFAKNHRIRFLTPKYGALPADRKAIVELRVRESLARQARDDGPPSLERVGGEASRVGEHIVWRRRFSEQFREDFCRMARRRAFSPCSMELAALLKDSALGYDEIINLPREPLFRASATDNTRSEFSSPGAMLAERS